MEAPPMKDTNCRKRQKASCKLLEGNQIHSLPNDIWIEILARLPRSCYLNLKLVCRSFKAAILSPELYKVRKELGNVDARLYILTSNKDGNLTCYVLDRRSRLCHRISQMPFVIGKKEPHDQLTFRGYGVGAVNGCKYVLGGFYNEKSINLVWRFDPILNCWSEVAPMSVGRAYSHTSVLDGKLYVVGGVSKSRGKLIDLHAGEVFDPSTGLWAQVPSMPFSKVRRWHLPVVNLNSLKFQVTGLAAYNGKLYAPQSYIYDGFSFFEICPLFGSGIGPAAKWARSSVVLNGQLHGISYRSYIRRGRIKIYDEEADRWIRVRGKLSVKKKNFVNSASRCLLSDFLGKLHVTTKDKNDNLVVVRAEKKPLKSRPRRANTVLEYMYVWKIIGSKAVGSEELVSCHVLDF